MGNFSLQNQVFLIPRPCDARTTYQTALLFKSFIFKSLSRHFNMDTHLTSKAVEQETALIGQKCSLCLLIRVLAWHAVYNVLVYSFVEGGKANERQLEGIRFWGGSGVYSKGKRAHSNSQCVFKPLEVQINRIREIRANIWDKPIVQIRLKSRAGPVHQGS